MYDEDKIRCRRELVVRVIRYVLSSPLLAHPQARLLQKGSRFQTTMVVKNIHVGLIGAGIGGLAAAIALRRAGARVTVLEAAQVLGEVRGS